MGGEVLKYPRRALHWVLVLSPLMSGSAAADETIGRLLNLPVPRSFEFCGETVPLDREDTAERLDLELMDTLGSPVRTALWFKRIPRYFPAIEAALEAKGLPQDLKYLTLIESNLRDDAVSSAGAVGPWQFMRGTALANGLEKKDWRDDARAWEDSTQAALAHLESLRQVFASWTLALAAYNSGAGRVSRAMESQGMPDFYGLRLPRETERYVFRAFAAKLVVENPEAYGIRLEGARLYFPEDTVTVDLEVRRARLPLRAVALAGGTSFRGLLRLNPWMTGADLPRGSHRVRLPKSGSADFSASVATWERNNPEPQVVKYRVRRGDTLSAIANRHGVDVDELRTWNGLKAQAILKKDQELFIHVTQ